MEPFLRRGAALLLLLLAGGVGLCAQPPGQPTQTPAARQQALDRAFLLRRGMGVRPSTHGALVARPIATAHARRLARTLLHSGTENAPSPALAGSATTWQAFGPLQLSTPAYGLVTGRVSSLVADLNDPTGNTVYLGATGGGVWKSTNAAGNAGSVTFTPLTDDLSVFANSMTSIPSLSIGAITVEPGNPNVLLAGTGDPNDALDSYYGVGILRSNNGGQTWSLIDESSDAAASGINYSFAGAGFAGFAWSTTTPGLVVAAVSQSLEGLLVDTQFINTAETGLFYSSDSGLTWHLATVADGPNQIIQSSNPRTLPPGNPATAVVWNPQRQLFFAAVRFHGYYSSSDGMNWTRLPSQPGANLSTQQCPADPGGTGSSSCPIFRGALAVQPGTGDTFALTTDIDNTDQGLYQDICSAANGSCSAPVRFGTQINDAALDDPNDAGVIDQADYNLSLSAVSSQQDTILFAGTEDIYRCSLANSCAWRDTTNDQTCASGMVAPSTHAIDGAFGAKGLVYFGNDGGLWRTTDTLAQTGPVCASTDASHFQNLNGGIGSLAEISHLAVSPGNGSLVLAGMGGFGVVASESAAAQGGTGAWQQLATGEGSYVQIDPEAPANWYASEGAGLSVFTCANGANCGAGSFGTTAAVDRDDIEDDADYFIDPAPWVLDPGNPANLIVGTCRMWLGPVSGGWTASNLLSGMLDGDPEPFCDGNAQLRSVGAGGSYNAAQGGEQMYAGMAGPLDGGGSKPGHLYGATVPQSGGQATWSDLWKNPVTNTALSPQFNAGGYAISSIAVDPHDSSGDTVYAGIAGFPYVQSGMLYRSTDAGAHWVNINNSLPPAPVNAVVVDPNNANYVYVAGDFGVYMTSNVAVCSTNQNCWSQLGSNLPNAPVTDLAVYADGATNILEASTYGRGIWTIGLTTTPATATDALTPASYTFPAQAAGSTSGTPAGFTLTNTGAVSMTIGNVAAAPADYAQTNNCGSALSAGASCTILVSFTPATAGSRTGTLTVTASTQPSTVSATLNGTGLTPGTLALSPSTLIFAATATGASSPAQAVTLTNTGGASLALNGETIGGADTNDFSVAPGNSCGPSLAAGAVCTVPVAFNPVQTGVRSATLKIASGSANSPAMVTLTGNGVAPAFLTLSPTSLSFAATAAGSTSQPQTIAVTNTGGSPAQLGAASVSGDYVLQSDTCGGTLAPSATCTVGIAFAPQAQGNRAGLFTLPSPSIPAGQVTAPLGGTGLQPATLTMSPNPVSFGAEEQGVTSAAQIITVTNTAGGTALLGAASVTGDFTLGANACTGSLALGANCSLAVTFTPAATGSRSGALTLAYDNGATATVALSGTGTEQPMLTFSPAAVSFPATAETTSSAAQLITVTNTGGNPAAFASVAVRADFTLTSNSCPAMPQTLAPGASCTLGIAFSPPGTASYTGAVTIAGSFSGSPASIPLVGQGATPPAAAFSPVSLNFPDTPQGGASAAQRLTLTSTGGVAVALGTPSVPADYQIAGDTCPAQLAPGASCALSVAFHPTATGARPGTLTQPGSMLNAPLTATLTGNGVAPGALSLTPQSLSFGAVVLGTTTAAQSVTLTNTGGAGIATGSPTVSGDYALAANTCPAMLAAGQSCTLSVSFAPTQSGDRPGQLTVPGGGAGLTAVTALDGAGETPGSLALAPSSVAFGTVALGSAATEMLTATNSGQVSVHLGSVGATGDFTITGGSCTAGVALAPSSGSCTVVIAFAPTATGQRTGALTLASDGTPALVSASLNGVGATPGRLTLTPAALDFGSSVEGLQSAVQAVTATNAGGVALSLGSPGVTGAGFIQSGTNCPASLAPGASCTVQVAFTPASAGAVQGQLAFPGSYSGSPLTVALTGTGLTPGQIVFSPSPVSFGPVAVQTTATQSIGVSNPGQEPVTLGAPTATSGFGVTSACPATLAGGAECVITVSFSPVAAGQLSGLLSLPSSVSGSAQTDALSGTGVEPGALAVNAASLSFPATEVGAASTAQTLTFSNSGGVGVGLNTPAISGADYTLTATSCGAALPPEGACTVSVAFTPAGSGSRPGTLTLRSSAANGPSVSVPLNGDGLAPPRLTLTPTSLSFGIQTDRTTSTPQLLTLTNTGGVAADLGLPLLSGPYALAASTCGSSLAAGAACTLSVLFAPTSAGSLPGAITVAAGGSLATTATLSGTGQALTLTPSALAFSPALPIGVASSVAYIAVANLGTATLTLGTPTLTGDFAITQNSCTATLAANSACAYGITFTPTAGGARTGVFTLSDGPETGSVQLSGQGLSPATDGLSPASLSFPLTVIGTSSVQQSVLLTNTGDATLMGISVGVTGPFTVSNNCGSQLGGHLSCAIAVSFAPVSAGAAAGTLTVTDTLRAQTVALAGNGVLPPTVSASPNSLDFGPYAVNAAAPGQMVTVANASQSTVTGLTPALSDPDFSLSTNTCPAALAPGASCQIGVVFTPQNPGTHQGTLTLTNTSGSAPLVVNLQGSGEDYSIAVVGSNTDVITAGQTATYQFQITPIGASAGTLTISCVGAPATTTCTANPSTLTMTANATGSVTLSVATAAATASAAPLKRGWLGGVALALLAPAFFAPRRQRARLLLLALALGMLVLPIACGVHASGVSSQNKTPAGQTPGGNYTLTVGAVFPGATRTTTVQLTVQ